MTSLHPYDGTMWKTVFSSSLCRWQTEAQRERETRVAGQKVAVAALTGDLRPKHFLGRFS